MLPQNFNLDEYSNAKKVLSINGSVFISEILAAPFERVKVKLVTSKPDVTSGLSHREEVIGLVKKIIRKEGWLNLYHGLKPSLDRQVFLNTTKFYAYYISMDHIFKNKKHEFFYSDILLSCLFATSIGTFFSQASDITRIRIQGEGVGEEKSKKVDPRYKMRKVLQYRRQTGTLLPGVGVSLVVQNVQAVTEIFSFFEIKKFLTRNRIFESNYIINGISALIASGLGALLSAPLDLIYTRMVFGSINAKETTLWRCVSEVIKKQGVKGLYRSFLPYFGKAAMFNLSMVTILEALCHVFKIETEKNPKKDIVK